MLCHTLQHSVQHVATQCNTLQRSATRWNAAQHVATQCNTLQRSATQRNTLRRSATRCDAAHHLATSCAQLQDELNEERAHAHAEARKREAADELLARAEAELFSMSERVAAEVR